MELIKKINTLPDCPGVYLMKNETGQIIYVGKACSLKKRVSSYFSKASRSPKQDILVSKIKDIDFMPTDSEAEALILEAGLIKEYKPRYNVSIKDDKTYPLLTVTVPERFPRLLVVRRKKDDRAKYFGPYTSARLLRQAISFMRWLFALRTCKTMPKNLCLNFHIGQCPGPCIAKVDEKTYRVTVENLLLFLKGRKGQLLTKLKEQMKDAAARQNFEEAARLRDQIISLESITVFHKRYSISGQLRELKTVLKLKGISLAIEAFDISNISGEEAVGAMVRFKDGQPDKSGYRRFRIKSVHGINDYAMLEEVLNRRYRNTLNEHPEFPDLIVIDGGQGHLQCALSCLRKINLNMDIISLAKQFEHIYVSWQTKPLALPRNSGALHLLMRIRDEAHRFALSYHRLLRGKKFFLSALDQIPGIGKKKKEILLKNMQDLVDLKNMSLEKLKKIKGIDEPTAKNIIEYWKSN